MIYLTMTRFVSQLRVYDEADGYAKRLPYKAILTVSHLTDSTVYLSAAVGEINREAWDKAMAMLAEQGVQIVMYERHGKMKTHEISHINE